MLGVVVARSNPSGRSTPKGIAEAHDYAIFCGNSEFAEVGRLPRTEQQLARYSESDEQGNFEWVNFRKHGGIEANRSARPKMYYPLIASAKGEVRVPEMEWNDSSKSWIMTEKPSPNEVIVWPNNGKNEEKRWKWGIESVKAKCQDFCAKPDQSGNVGAYVKSRMNDEGMLPLTWWDKKEYSATEYGTNLLKDIFGRIEDFSFPKALDLVKDCLRVTGLCKNAVSLDFFGGSGTTGHAVINLNREDHGSRKYILVEMGSYFDSVLKPRIQKVIHSKDWKDGKPISRDSGISHMFKYIRLESYEDCLNNLVLQRTDGQQTLLDANPEFRQSYMLGYMLDTEAAGSPSLLNIDAFEDPFNYKLNIAEGSVGETKPVNVDLVETFNYLLGLRVKHIDTIRDYRVVEGYSPKDEKVLVIWRNTKEKSNEDLEDFVTKEQYNTLDMEFDLIYVNGDNNLENIKKDEDTWKVRLIEEEFQRLMFDVQEY